MNCRFLIPAVALLASCASGPEAKYEDPNSGGPITMDFDRSDFKIVSDRLVSKFLGIEPTKAWDPAPAGERPLLDLGEFSNRSDVHVKAELVALKDKLRNALLNSSKYRFVIERQDKADTIETKQAVEQSGQYDTKNTGKKWNAPEYTLRATFYSIRKKNEDKGIEDVYYYLSLKVDSIQGGSTVWTAEAEIAKSKERSAFGS